MDSNELQSTIYCYVIDHILTYEEYHSLGGPDKFHKWCNEHFRAIPKNELIIGKEYNGECRNASKATWDGKVFHYMRYKWGSPYEEDINHYEDDDDFDVFVPIEEVKEEND